MNKFEYTLLIDKIEKMKTLKDKEALLRKLAKDYSKDLHQYTWGNLQNLDVVLPYKCYAKTLKAYDGKYLPLFLQDTYKDTSTVLLDYAVENKIEYDQLCDMFEFTDTIRMSSSYLLRFVPTLALIVKDRELPFKIKYNFYTDSKYNALMTVDKNNRFIPNFTEIIELEEVKRSLPSDIKYTIIEELLEERYKNINAPDTTHHTATLIKQYAINLNTVIDTVITKMKGLK